MAEGESTKKRRLEINWEEFHRQTDGNGWLPEVVREKNNRTDDDRSPRRQSPPPPPETAPEDAGHSALKQDCLEMSDQKLEESIRRQKSSLSSLRRLLPDKGKKLAVALRVYEEELERRKSERARMVVDESKQTTHLEKPGINGTRSGASSSEVQGRSQFASLLCKKMDDNIDRKAPDAFKKEFSALGHASHEKEKPIQGLPHKERQRNGSSRRWPFQSSRQPSVDNVGHKKKDISISSFYSKGESIARKFSNGREDSQVPSSHRLRPRKGEYVDLSDDDDEVLETANCGDENFDECMKDDKIYYPSRNDLDSVEVSYKDIEHLAPQSFLTSTVINFYIRYLQLQVFPSKRSTCDYHIFNTFFYSKLKQALSGKGDEKESLFAKFRKWWKGVNLFEKAYVLIPINYEEHWSLVIICFPEKEDESGPMMLHLDSLEFHSSRAVFDHITSFLREEWKYLHQDIAPSVEMSDRIWKRLRKISSRSVQVPQQQNEYDCGIFVLFFMERFIEEAPERLKQENLDDMFGRCWFDPKEARCLRRKLRNLLITEFRNQKQGANER